jgi:hypothetical protein
MKEVRSMRQVTSLALCFLFCACSEEHVILKQDWAVIARAKMAPSQREVKGSELLGRWKVPVNGEKDRWGVGEASLEDIRGLEPGTKVVVRIPPGTTILEDDIDLEGIHLEIVGKGSDISRLSLNAGPRGLVLNGGKLIVKNVTVSASSSEGLTVLGGDLEAEGVVFNGGRHGLYISRGEAKIRRCIFMGNESGLDLGKKTRVFVEESVFHGNWAAISGEKPRLMRLKTCLILDSIHQAFALRFGQGMGMNHCLVVGNPKLGWTGNPADSVITNNLLQYGAFDGSDIDDRSNYPLDRLKSFPGSTPKGVPSNFPTPMLMLLQKRLATVGTAGSLRTVCNYAEDQASKCLKRAELYLEQDELRKSRILLGVAKGFAQPYKGLRQRFGERIKTAEDEVKKKQIAKEQAKEKKKQSAKEETKKP